MASDQSNIDCVAKQLGLNVRDKAEEIDGGGIDDTDAPTKQPPRSENHLEFSEPEYSKPSPTSSLVDILAYVGRSGGGGRYKSLVDEMVEKSTKAVYLTQKTSLKIALLIDAIMKKQTSLLRRLTGRAKPDPDVVAFQEYLGSLQQQENLWSTVCSSTLSESGRVKKDLAEHPEIFQAMKEARTDLLRIDREIRADIVEPLKSSLIDGSRPNYVSLRMQTETFGAAAMSVCKAICLQLVSVTPRLREALEARKEGHGLQLPSAENGPSSRKQSIVIPLKLQGLSQEQLLDAISTI